MLTLKFFLICRPAYDIELSDNSWLRENFTAVAGSLQARWEKLAPGANLTHNFVIAAPRPAIYVPSPAIVTYQSTIRGGARPATAYSSIPHYGYLRVYRPNEVPHRSLPHYTEWIVFVALVAAGLALPAMLYTSSRATYSALKRK